MTNWSVLLPSSFQLTGDSSQRSGSRDTLHRKQDKFYSFGTSVSTDDSTCSSRSSGDRSTLQKYDIEAGAALVEGNAIVASKFASDHLIAGGLQHRRKQLSIQTTRSTTDDECSSQEDSDDVAGLHRGRSWSQHCCRSIGPFPISNTRCPLRFRRIQPSDKEEIKRLHELWFPVKYMDDFYDDLVYERMTGTGDPLFTSVGYRTDADRHTIVACVVGSFVKASSLSAKLRSTLISNSYQHTKLFYIMTVGTTIQKQGIGPLLIQQCLQQAHQHPDCGVVYLHVLTTNSAAIKMYESLGFDRVQEIPNYYTTTDNVRRNCYLYAKYVHGNFGHRALWKRLLTRWNTVKSLYIYLASFCRLSFFQPPMSAMLSSFKPKPAEVETVSFQEDIGAHESY